MVFFVSSVCPTVESLVHGVMLIRNVILHLICVCVWMFSETKFVIIFIDIFIYCFLNEGSPVPEQPQHKCSGINFDSAHMCAVDQCSVVPANQTSKHTIHGFNFAQGMWPYCNYF